MKLHPTFRIEYMSAPTARMVYGRVLIADNRNGFTVIGALTMRKDQFEWLRKAFAAAEFRGEIYG